MYFKAAKNSPYAELSQTDRSCTFLIDKPLMTEHNGINEFVKYV